jgi:ABC-type Zn uptake system ZnuABC Zn-binding protein ZnuA
MGSGTIGWVAALVLSGCGKQSTSSDTLDWTIPALTAADLSSGAKLQVVATTSIVGDIVKNVGGDAIDLKVLLPVGTDPPRLQCHAPGRGPQ